MAAIIDKLKWKLANFMQHRNGSDDLCKGVLIGSILLYIVYVLTQYSFLYLLSFCGILYALFRTFSRNIAKRQTENEKYLRFFRLQKKRFSMRKEYRIFTCKGCGQHIRVPRKKGKVEITCPVCGRKAIHRT